MGWYSDNLLKLKSADISNAEGELCALIEFISGISYSEILKKRLLAKTNEDCILDIIPKTKVEKLSELVCLRVGGEPLQYITGKTDFYGYEFFCKKGVLIPRFDTETLIDTALEVLNKGDIVLDLCCGSGCIGITLALEKNITLTLADISPDAVSLTTKNADYHGVNAEIIFHDVFNDKLNKQYNVIVCNPPYIETNEINTLSKDVQNEPALALDGGADGFCFYRYIISNYKYALKSGGYLIFECGINQAPQIAAMLENSGYKDIIIKKDYANIERVLICKL